MNIGKCNKLLKDRLITDNVGYYYGVTNILIACSYFKAIEAADVVDLAYDYLKLVL